MSTLVVLICLFCATSCLLSDSVPDISITVGTNSIPVVFEDASLTEVERRFFKTELERFFHYSTTMEESFPENWNSRGFRNYHGPQYIYAETDFSRGLGYTNAPNQRLHVFQRFTNRYCLNGATYTAYTNLQASADQFVASLNNGSVTNYPISAKRDLFLILPAPPPSWNDTAMTNDLAEIVQGAPYFPPTFFDFQMENPVPPFTLPIPTLILKNRDPECQKIISLPIIHANGAWKFLDIVE